ncbi:unnamed protein product [Phytophthora lilii]|uniref:Unnamed protein product n=1 Tax=Phytophthora lilii TaxID=2077276 RepID=A0A9W6TDH6_9STRA|nr:unnamed protein product [Phytophthora lilii]
MSLNDPALTNTKRGRKGAARLFKVFSRKKGVTEKYLEVFMKRDPPTPPVFETVVDKLCFILRSREEQNDRLLEAFGDSVLPPGQELLLDQFPQHRVVIDKALLKKGQVLDEARPGNFVKKAPPCMKKALKQMMLNLCSTGVMTPDYQDSTACSGIYLDKRLASRFSQDPSLFPDDDFSTFPLAIAVALATQSAAAAALLNHPSEQQVATKASLTPVAPVIDLIDNPDTVASLASASKDDKPPDDTTGSTTSQ